MATYLVTYNMKKGTNNATSSKTAVAETERSAIEIAKGQGKHQYPDRDLFSSRLKRKRLTESVSVRQIEIENPD